MPTRVVTAAPRWAAADSTSASVGEVHHAARDRGAQGHRALGQLGAARRADRRRSATASAVRWNRPRRGVGSTHLGLGRPQQLVAGSFATAAVVARSATTRWARRSAPRRPTGRPRPRGPPRAVRPGGSGGCGRRPARRRSRARGSWRPASRGARTAAPHLVAAGDPGRPGHRVGEPHALARPPRPARRRPAWRRVVDAEQPHRGAPPRAAHHRTDRVEEDA